MKTALTFLFVLFLCGPATAQDLPPDILADQYLLEATEGLDRCPPWAIILKDRCWCSPKNLTGHREKEEGMILVFSGAGGSAAVDPGQYPTTREFFNQLPKEIKNNPLFSSVRALLAQHYKKVEPDIEDVLQILDAGQAVFPTENSPSTLLEWIMSGEMSSVFSFSGVSDWGTLRPSFAPVSDGTHCSTQQCH